MNAQIGRDDICEKESLSKLAEHDGLNSARTVDMSMSQSSAPKALTIETRV